MINKLLLLFIVLAIIYFIYLIKKTNRIEGIEFSLDPLFIPENPIHLNDIDTRRFVRTVGIKRNLKIDKNGRIETITYTPPKPELGENICIPVDCDPQYQLDVCWKCL